jgi:hypothetical protein
MVSQVALQNYTKGRQSQETNLGYCFPIQILASPFYSFYLEPESRASTHKCSGPRRGMPASRSIAKVARPAAQEPVWWAIRERVAHCANLETLQPSLSEFGDGKYNNGAPGCS